MQVLLLRRVWNVLDEQRGLRTFDLFARHALEQGKVDAILFQPILRLLNYYSLSVGHLDGQATLRVFVHELTFLHIELLRHGDRDRILIHE